MTSSDNAQQSTLPPSTTGASALSDASAPAPRKFQLQAEHELRFEIPHDVTSATLTLDSGSAELFGVELALNRPYVLSPSLNAAVFTWHGAVVLLSAHQPVMAYTATDTPMPSYVSAHAVLQSKRRMAQAAGLPGPRAIVVGPKDSGKTALVTTLAAYSVKENGRVVVVDLDPGGCGAAGVVAGSISLSVVTHLDLDVGGLVHDHVLSILVGHASPRLNDPVSRACFDGMGEVMDVIGSTQALQPHIGCIMDTSGDVDGKGGPELVAHAAKALKADVVFVVGAERLYATMKTAFENSTTETVLLNKSGGVVSRDDAARMAMQSGKVREYFYGVDNSFNPFSAVVDFEQTKVLKVGGVASVVPDSVLPAGAESTLDPLKPREVTALADVLHHVLGVSQAEDEDKVVGAPLYGFVHVVKVDAERNTMTVLCPSPGKMPGRFLVGGDMKWIE